MHELAVPLFCDATGVAVALTAWARHRCLQLYFSLSLCLPLLVFFLPVLYFSMSLLLPI